jgi:hypothetical protein
MELYCVDCCASSNDSAELEMLSFSEDTSSKYAQHILETGHTYGTIENTLNILQFEKKSQKMNSLEQYYIYRLTRENLQLNDTYTNNYNPIFHIITDYYK